MIYSILTAHRITCDDCGRDFYIDSVDKTVNCLHCGVKILRVEPSVAGRVNCDCGHTLYVFPKARSMTADEIELTIEHNSLPTTGEMERHLSDNIVLLFPQNITCKYCGRSLILKMGEDTPDVPQDQPQESKTLIRPSIYVPSLVFAGFIIWIITGMMGCHNVGGGFK